MKRKSLLLGLFCLLLPALQVTANVYYVNANNAAPASPFMSWASAATNIQDAVNLTTTGDTVLVTNGVYAFGGQVISGTLLNRLALTNAITVQSVNGPWVTTILGAGATNGSAAVRCAWLTNGAALIGFTLTAGATLTSGDTTTMYGGGAWCASTNAFLGNCVIVSNTAYQNGGGVYQGTVINSLMISNGTGITSGGAAYKNILNNCTIVSNTTYGVTSPMAMTNCIIYYNGLSGNYSVSGSAFANCCTTPALSGTGNMTNAPHFFADGIHLTTNSPCLGAGVNTAYTASGTDIFGLTWSNPPSIGCAEWNPAPVLFPHPVIQFPPAGEVTVGVNVDGQPPLVCWWSKDGALVQNNGHDNSANTPTLLINNINVADGGAYQLVVSNSFGVVTSAVSQLSVHCVSVAGSTPLPPYSGWTTAATNIQDAINAAQAGDIILVTNGVYAFGGTNLAPNTTTNRVILNKAVLVQSVNGPWVTTIQGGNVASGTAAAIRCAWLTNGASLTGFTLQGGGTWGSADYGGGVCCASSNAYVVNCLICSNSAGFYGGGTYQGTLWNCAINANKASTAGGTYSSYLNNCTVVGNSGSSGAVIYGGFTNCIIYYNSNANVTASSGSASYCCALSLPSGGVGNFTNPPQLFVDKVHLAANSPCIGAGANIGLTTDIAGQPWASPPSIGCSEASTVPLVAQPTFQLTGNPVGFVASAAITGTGTLNCWWLLNGAPVQNSSQWSGAQTATLTATGVNFADVGAYQLVVSNSFGVVTSSVAQLTIHCVNIGGSNPVTPYSTWATAATNIQAAITASSAGDIVLVTNGLYATGGISMDGVITNRVSVNKAILLQSVNGSGTTVIQGAWDPTATNGPGAVRCAWLTTNAIIDGFTLCGGATRAYSTGGQAIDGGGIYGSLSNQTLVSVAANCLIISNAASGYGGGAYQTILNGCTLATNLASNESGGGASGSNLKNCVVVGNQALFLGTGGSGGGTYNCNLTNCAVIKNRSTYYGGGAYEGTLVNCTVTGNQVGTSSYGYGGGVATCTLANCIVYLNFAEATAYLSESNSYNSTFSYSCTGPAASGTGNIAVDPLLLADGIHLSAASPCIGVGTESAVSGTDIDGQAWNNPPSMGCDEWQPAPVVAVQPNFQLASPVRGFTCSTAIAGQAPFACFWTLNGTPIQDNGHYSNSGTPSLVVNNFGPDDAGLYQVVVTNSAGSVTSAVSQLVIHVVNAAGQYPVTPYSSWANAATNIQDAINAAAPGDIVLVTNGLYAFGGIALSGGVTNRVGIYQPISVISVNGWASTMIEGAWDPIFTNGPDAIRCAYVTDGALLYGFTLANGATAASDGMVDASDSGGGVYCVTTNGLIFNCVLSNNFAIFGGGIANGTLNNSLVINNQANNGGGAYAATLNNCTAGNNYAIFEGGGVYAGLIRNSIVIANYLTPGLVENDCFFQYSWECSYSCTSPTISLNSISANPQFLDLYHISTTSPCRGAGSAQFATGTDLDGEPWANPPSMGCDEVVLSNLVGSLSVGIYAPTTNFLMNRYEGFYGGYTGRASSILWNFADGVTVTNSGYVAGHEWTNPGNYTVTFTVYNNSNPTGVSTNIVVQVLPLLSAQLQSPGLVSNAFQFQFAGQRNANYVIQYTTNLSQPSWQTLQTIYQNQGSSLQITDPGWTNGPRFYRVSSQ